MFVCLHSILPSFVSVLFVFKSQKTDTCSRLKSLGQIVQHGSHQVTCAFVDKTISSVQRCQSAKLVKSQVIFSLVLHVGLVMELFTVIQCFPFISKWSRHERSVPSWWNDIDNWELGFHAESWTFSKICFSRKRRLSVFIHCFVWCDFCDHSIFSTVVWIWWPQLKISRKSRLDIDVDFSFVVGWAFLGCQLRQRLSQETPKANQIHRRRVRQMLREKIRQPKRRNNWKSQTRLWRKILIVPWYVSSSRLFTVARRETIT